MERQIVIKKIATFCAVIAAIGFGAVFMRPAGADFGQQGTYGGVSTGAANAQVILLPGVASMSQLRGVTISFTVGAGFTNTGPATLAVNNGSTTLSAVNVDRMNSGTLMALGGGEMPAGQMVQAMYDGTELVLLTNYASGVPTGQVGYFVMSSCPSGWSAANGSNGTVNTVGQFIRSLNTGSTGFDPNRTLASAQSNSVQALNWSGSAVTTLNGTIVVGSQQTETSGAGQTVPGAAFNINSGNTTQWTTTVTGTVGGTGTETRPQNVALLACQKN